MFLCKMRFYPAGIPDRINFFVKCSSLPQDVINGTKA
jgi:hypothetical protein